MRFSSFVIHAGPMARACASVLEKRLLRQGLSCASTPESAVIRLSECPFMPGESARVVSENGIIEICAGSKTGMLAGAGRMLRACAFSNGGASLKDGCVFEGSPAFPLRGMQLGYRSLSNANDAWTKEMYTDYIEDLALFGMNAVEILPDDESDKKQTLMKYPLQEMNRHIAETCLRLGLEIWYWLPHKGTFMKNDAEKRAVLASAYEKFCALPHLDHIFIPGADPGDLEPEDLFEFARLVKADAQKIHREVKMWLSPQVFSFTPERLEGFFSLLNAEPEWLDGVVFGPWERDDAFVLRKKTPERYPVRNYPDICACRSTTGDILKEWPQKPLPFRRKKRFP